MADVKNAGVPFAKPAEVGNERKYIADALAKGRLSGDQAFSVRCATWLARETGGYGVLMTPSCTHALELAALALGLSPGDEVIMPSFTFSSTANAFVLQGATPVFIDIRSDTLNLDETQIEQAVTKRTKAVVPVHYAGVACDMDAIAAVAETHAIAVVEDAAQALLARYRGRALGGLGHLNAFSFHETKNVQCGEGGALVVRDEELLRRAEVIREKGTNRTQYLRGEVDKYTWVDKGSSHLLGELPAAFLLGQLEGAEGVKRKRVQLWNRYYEGLIELQSAERLILPTVPAECEHNGHIFHVRVGTPTERNQLIRFLNSRGVGATFHYVPLHTSPAGRKYGEFRGEDRNTTLQSDRLVRLPLFFHMSEDEVARVLEAVSDFFRK
jgi:dTDP-4-amino-4,6-dideoxygalactose transaminase